MGGEYSGRSRSCFRGVKAAARQTYSIERFRASYDAQGYRPSRGEVSPSPMWRCSDSRRRMSFDCSENHRRKDSMPPYDSED